MYRHEKGVRSINFIAPGLIGSGFGSGLGGEIFFILLLSFNGGFRSA
jgi:hypothetical protein